jgi:DNA-binding PadR family transcriptional regulator
MSVPAALTAILTLGPAYGLQLHGELGARLPHRANTNVGQIYSTLERLTRDGLVERSGETLDGLPLYAITAHGHEKAREWLAAGEIMKSSPWTEIIDVLILGSTINAHAVEQACARVRDISWGEGEAHSLSSRASSHFETAVLAIVNDVEESIRSGSLPLRGLDDQRPTRGRRPKSNS